ncbi:hypothetical protein K466DRAFT_582441 [Polyporus arcularius HHB13444]|uniref:Uncharacterized protein n=1 Tax=Polyporus arcularius HHB13444 TaxID=1314778 RepID=A0A5C3PR19_9APHY|nr:hypothetical protein K466DRAFT_582441 [Polyporus arcularius HHB13444]
MDTRRRFFFLCTLQLGEWRVSMGKTRTRDAYAFGARGVEEPKDAEPQRMGPCEKVDGGGRDMRRASPRVLACAALRTE